jgi:ABC-type antimicrobial peptide transport system permease subunit
LSAQVSLKINTVEHRIELRYIGTHEFIPGVSSVGMSNALIIGEDSWRQLIGEDNYVNYTSNNWILKIDSIEGENLKALRANVEADWRVSSAMDWSTEHEKVERDSGLIFGTPGLLSLQFVVASLAAIASSFVFLSLVLNQRKKELAILQAIGASPNQIIRLVLFEILSIVIVSMALGVLLGMGLALAFNGFFGVFGFIFQIFGSTATPIDRDLVWPWFELGIVSLSVFIAVVMALLFTTRKALRSDLASVLKGE